jgi:hypothetical protein
MSGNEAAFPILHTEFRGGEDGLTKREYAAIAILAAMVSGILSNPNLEINDSSEERAVEAVHHADALLAELAK